MNKSISDERMYLCFAKNGLNVGQLFMKIFSCVHCAWVCVMYFAFNLPALLAIYNLICDFFFISLYF